MSADSKAADAFVEQLQAEAEARINASSEGPIAAGSPPRLR